MVYMPNSTSQNKFQRESWWPTIGAIVLLIIIVILGAFSYQSYAHNVELSAENGGLHSRMSQLTADKDTLTTQIAESIKEIAKLKCLGVWNGEACVAPKVSIVAEPASGKSPLAVVLKVRAPHSKYAIDFGDGSATVASLGAECTPDIEKLCTFTIKHMYKFSNATSSTFVAKITSEGKTDASTEIKLTDKHVE